MLTNDAAEIDVVLKLPTSRVLELNRRQIASALQYVYGPSSVALRPDDDNAEFGF